MPDLKKLAAGGALLAATFLLGSCSSLLTSTMIEPTVANLQQQTDLELVCEGAPAYLLMIDAMIARDPESTGLLQAGAQAYSGYLAAMAECGSPPERLQTVAEKARLYGTSLIQNYLPISDDESKQLLQTLDKVDRRQAVPLFWGTLAWLNWIQQQQGAPGAMADLITVEKIMARLLVLDPTIQAGAPHLFFAGYYATRPPMFGGDPDKSRHHFEEALRISERKNLLVQTTYAETLARQLFDRELHDSLLREVLDFPLAEAPGYSLSNQIAKRRAARLLAEDFFAE